MYCPQCGNQNPDNSRFCGSCGAPLENIRTHAAFPQMGEATGRVGSEGRGDPKKDPNRKRKWILAVPVVAVIAAAVPVVVLLVLPNNAGENPSVEAQVQEAESTPTEIPKQETEENVQTVQWTDLKEYAEQELLLQLGSCDLGPFTCDYVMEDGSLGQHAAEGQEGVIVYSVRDFDGDSQEELLAAVMEPDGTRQDMPGEPVNAVVLQMYEMDGGRVELTDEYQILNGVLGTADREDDWVFFRPFGNGIYILGSAWQFQCMYADGTYVSAAVVRYDGKGFVEEAADTAMGSDFSDVDVSSLTNTLEEIGGFDHTVSRMKQDRMAYFDDSGNEDVFFSIYGENALLDNQEAADEARNRFQETEDPSDLGEKTVEIYPGSHPYGQEISQTMHEEVSGEADPENLQGNASYYNELTLLEKKEQEMEDSATDQASMNRVSGEIYEMWDDELNYVYQQLKKTLTEEEFQQLKEEELQWIEYRDQLGEEAAREWEGGSGMPMAVNTALSEATKTRTYELAYRWISGWRP